MTFWQNAPGAELLDQGLKDLAANQHSLAALLVLIGEPRLRRCHVPVPTHKPLEISPEKLLYSLLILDNPRTAHSAYNGYIRRLVSLEQFLESQS